MDHHSDEHYIKRVLSGDQSSYAMLVERHKNMVYTITMKMLRNREEAEEVAQDAFLKAYKSLNKFKQQSKFSTWLYKITYNLCISQLRKKKQNVFSIDGNEGETTFDIEDTHQKMDNLEQTERKELLECAVSELNEEEQTIVTMYYHEDLSTEEISEITGLSVSNVKVKLYRARKRLYKNLSSKLKDEIGTLR